MEDLHSTRSLWMVEFMKWQRILGLSFRRRVAPTQGPALFLRSTTIISMCSWLTIALMDLNGILVTRQLSAVNMTGDYDVFESKWRLLNGKTNVLSTGNDENPAGQTVVWTGNSAILWLGAIGPILNVFN